MATWQKGLTGVWEFAWPRYFNDHHLTLAEKSNKGSKMSKIKWPTIKGYKSIRSLEQFELNNLNVLIGANGVGKSNFVGYFKTLHELVEGRFKIWTSKQGGADRILSYGIKETTAFLSTIRFGDNGYTAELIPTVDSSFTFKMEEYILMAHIMA